MRGIFLTAALLAGVSSGALAVEAKSTGTAHELQTTTPIAVTSASTAAISATFTSGKSGIQSYRLVCDLSVHMAIGTSPTATVNDPYLPAEVVEYQLIRENYKLALKSHGTGSGTCWLTKTQQ